MEQIELVIRIPEESFNHYLECSEDSRDEAEIGFAVRHGTLLPKGHGRLIDRSKLEMSDIAPEPWYRPMMAYTEWTIDDAEVVIEADKEGAEE